MQARHGKVTGPSRLITMNRIGKSISEFIH